MKVFIIPATYNEKDNIEKLIEKLQEEVFPKIKNHSLHILVADDTSPDGTADIVRGLMKKYKNLDVNIGPKKGLGASYIRAMSYAIEKKGADVLVSIDADLQHDPSTLPEFLKKIDEGYDLVVGTRYSNGGSMPKNWPFYRKVFSVGANTLVRFLTGRFYLHDWTGGYRAYKKEVFLKEREKLRAYSGYTFQVAALYKSLQDGFKISEVPIHFYSRKAGDSKIAPTEYIINLFTYVLKERAKELVRSPFLKYAITGFMGYIINAVSLEWFFHQGFTPAVAGAIGAELSIIWNFIVNNFWAFNQYKITNPFKVILKFPQFNLVSLGSLVIITTILGIGTHFFGEHTRQLFLIIAIGFFVIPYSYTMYNIFIWKRWHVSFLSKLQDLVG